MIDIKAPTDAEVIAALQALLHEALPLLKTSQTPWLTSDLCERIEVALPRE